MYNKDIDLNNPTMFDLNRHQLVNKSEVIVLSTGNVELISNLKLGNFNNNSKMYQSQLF